MPTAAETDNLLMLPAPFNNRRQAMELAAATIRIARIEKRQRDIVRAINKNLKNAGRQTATERQEHEKAVDALRASVRAARKETRHLQKTIAVLAEKVMAQREADEARAARIATRRKARITHDQFKQAQRERQHAAMREHFRATPEGLNAYGVVVPWVVLSKAKDYRPARRKTPKLVHAEMSERQWPPLEFKTSRTKGTGEITDKAISLHVNNEQIHIPWRIVEEALAVRSCEPLWSPKYGSSEHFGNMHRAQQNIHDGAGRAIDECVVKIWDAQ
jgi:hypothetical protein